MIRRVRSYLHTDSVEELESQTELILDTLHKQELQPSVVVVTSDFVSVGVFKRVRIIGRGRGVGEERGSITYLAGSGGQWRGKLEQVDRRF